MNVISFCHELMNPVYISGPLRTKALVKLRQGPSTTILPLFHLAPAAHYGELQRGPYDCLVIIIIMPLFNKVRQSA